jgi:putative sigma-54 modulation protein
MEILLTARHFKVSDNLKTYIESETLQLDKLSVEILECHVILIKEKINYFVEIALKVPHDMLTAKEYSDNFYKSVDKVVKKLERQIKKYKGKNLGFSHKKISEVLLNSELM